MATAQTMNIVNRSATTAPMPVKSNPDIAVAKLIDESKCIGCKACQVACMQWNDNRDEIGSTVGVYDNPADLTRSHGPSCGLTRSSAPTVGSIG